MMKPHSKDLESIKEMPKKKKIRTHPTLRGTVGKLILPSFPQVIFLKDIFITTFHSMPVIWRKV